MDELKIVVSTILDANSKHNIQEQLKNLKPKIQIQAEIGNLEEIKRQLKELQQLSNNGLNGSRNSSGLDSEKQNAKNLLEIYKQIYNNKLATIKLNNSNFVGSNTSIKNEIENIQKSINDLNVGKIKEVTNQLRVLQSNISLTNSSKVLKEIDTLYSKVSKLDFGSQNNYIPQLDNIKKKFVDLQNSNISSVRQFKEQYIKELQSLSNNIKQSLLDRNNAIFKRNVDNFKEMVDKIIKHNSKLRKHVLSQQINDLKLNLTDPTALANAQKQFNVLKSQARELGLLTGNIFSEIGMRTKRLLEYFGIMSTMTFVITQLRNMVKTIYEVDTAMTSLKKVTNGTDLAYKTFFNNAIGLAEKLYGKISDVIQATAEWAKLGYSIQDATKLAELNLLYKNVGDVDVQTGTKDMVSVQKAFKVSTEDMITVLDKYNEVSNNYSISMAGIGEGMRRSSSAMKLAGNDLNDTIALLVAGNNVLQDPAIVGTFLKTASMRIRGAGGLTAEMKNIINTEGLDMEGTLDTITKVQAKIKQLTNNQVDIMLNPDTFKSTYNILKEISDVWDNITDRNKAEIVEIIGGNEPQLALYVQKCA